MEKAKVKQIADFLRDVYEGICEQDGTHIQQIQLTELYRVIETLMDEIAKTKDESTQYFWPIWKSGQSNTKMLSSSDYVCVTNSDRQSLNGVVRIAYRKGEENDMFRLYSICCCFRRCFRRYIFNCTELCPEKT